MGNIIITKANRRVDRDHDYVKEARWSESHIGETISYFLSAHKAAQRWLVEILGRQGDDERKSVAKDTYSL